MTRGKYAARAATRRDTTESTTTIETYQHKVAKLAAENAELRTKLERVERTRAQEVRQLTAQVREAVSPELQARNLALKDLREQHGKILRRLQQLDEAYSRFLTRLHGQPEMLHMSHTEFWTVFVPRLQADSRVAGQAEQIALANADKSMSDKRQRQEKVIEVRRRQHQLVLIDERLHRERDLGVGSGSIETVDRDDLTPEQLAEVEDRERLSIG